MKSKTPGPSVSHRRPADKHSDGSTRLTRADLAIYAGTGLGVWLNGAVSFRLAGAFLFRSGPLVTAAMAIVIAVCVCILFRATLLWRGGCVSQATTIAAVMATPGLAAEAGRMLFFHAMTGLGAEDIGPFAAVIFFGNAALFAYSLQWQLLSPTQN